MANNRHSENQKIAISRQQYDQLSRNSSVMRTDPLNPDGHSNFKYPRWQMTIILKV